MPARLAVLLFIVASAASAHSQETPKQQAKPCPWLTAGTAEAMLGGEATATVAVTGHPDGTAAGSCRFVRNSRKGPLSIDILVGAADTHPCPPDSVKLKAIGNEATQCRHVDATTPRSDQIAGRVRRTFFVVTMTGVADAIKAEPSDPRIADAYGASPIQRLAEIVAGNLF
jgi:hypothetical protein